MLRCPVKEKKRNEKKRTSDSPTLSGKGEQTEGDGQAERSVRLCVWLEGKWLPLLRAARE